MARKGYHHGNLKQALVEATIKRLEDEQSAFTSFLQRLRDAKDKTEFDRFMEERAGRNGNVNA